MMKKILFIILILACPFNINGQIYGCMTRVVSVTLEPSAGTNDINMSINSTCCEVHNLADYNYNSQDNIVNVCYIDTGLLLPTSITSTITLPNANNSGNQTITLNSHFAFGPQNECFSNIDQVYNQTFNLTFDGPLMQPRIYNLDTNSFENNKVNLYPNPNNGIFSVDYSTNFNNVQLSIYDITGKRLFSIKDYVSGNQIDAKHLSKGMYIVKIENNSATETLKFIIN